MKNKLSKLKMPKRDEVDMSELDMEAGPEEGAEAEGPEMELEVEAEGSERPAEGSSDLEGVADEDLIAELKKRGLMGKLAEEGDMDLEAEDEESYA